MSKLSHFNQEGKAYMVDVSSKEDTNRVAIATGNIFAEHDNLVLIKEGTAKKGDVLGIARVAAIQAIKKTSELIPLCHNIFISKVNVEFNLNLEDNFVNCEVTVQSLGKTGVEMEEALTGVSIGLLTIYDMCKAVDRKMTIKDVRVLEKKVVNLVIGILDSLFVFLFACNSFAQAEFLDRSWKTLSTRPLQRELSSLSPNA